MKPLAERFLYTFVDSAYLRGREPAEICRALCDGGSDIIQLRAKGWPADRIEATALELRTITRDYDVALVVNDYPEIARRAGADLCHLGQEDFFDAGHRQASEFAGLKIGLSTHAPEQAQRAIAADPAYLAVGPIYPTGTKPDAQPVTLEYVRWAAINVSIPWFAIGGITLQNLAEVLAAGATRIGVVSAILNSENIAADCAAFRRKVSEIAYWNERDEALKFGHEKKRGDPRGSPRHVS